MSLTYNQLKQAIQDYAENDETTFVSNIDNFIRQAENRIYRAVTLPDLRTNVIGNFTASNRFLTKPAGYLSTFSIAVLNSSGDYDFLIQKDVNFVREAFPSRSTEGQPRFFAEFNDTSFIVGPTPDQAYEVQLHYYKDPESIIDNVNGRSWIGDNAESSLLYGCLLEAYTFMKGEPDVLAMYADRYESAIQELVKLVEGRYKRDSYRDGEPRIEV